MRQIVFVVIANFFIISTINAQDFYSIRGTVTDKQTGETLPYVHIYTNHYIGTISNTNGDFVFKIPLSHRSDSLFVSYIGYTTYSLFLGSSKQNLNLNIDLVSSPAILGEVLITPLKGIELIEDAISKIPLNYSNKPIMLTGFYREVVNSNPHQVNQVTIFSRLEGKDISEAVCEIYYSSYPFKKNDKIEKDYFKLLAWRKENEIKDSLHKSFTGTGLNNIVKNDIVKHIDNSFLQKKKRKYYNFKLRETAIYENQMTYIIDFDQKDNISKSLYKGTIYLDAESLAFINIDYSLSPKGLKYNAEKKILHIGFKVNNSQSKIEYKKNANNKWSLYFVQKQDDIDLIIYNNFMTSEYFKEENKDKEKLFHNLQFKSELIINEIKTNEIIKFSKNELFKRNTRLTEQINNDNIDIWGKYNYIISSDLQ